MTDTKNLITKLNPLLRKALEEAAQYCVSLTHFTVEIEHFLVKINDNLDGDWAVSLKAFNVDGLVLAQQLSEAIDKFKRGNSRTPAFSPLLLKLIEEAWIITSLTLESSKIRSSAILLALLEAEGLKGVLIDSCPILLTIPRLVLRQELSNILQNSGEEEGPTRDQVSFPSGESKKKTGSYKTEALDLYTQDLTEAARSGKIDPVTGREGEIRQIIDILMRRRQNNPILTGDAGVGKTAVVEGLALKIAAGDVPPPLQNVSIRSLDVGLLEAGAGLKGEFEQRLKSVISEVQASPTPIILFIDEAHTLIGSGSSGGQNDAANLLKPALARGELRTIAATTWAEYKKYFEKDAALSRRFQVVKVEEPDEEKAILMLRGLLKKLEAHHKVRIEEEALESAVKISNRYLAGRKLPDKAVSVLDTACARVAVAHNSIPEALEALNYQEQALEIEKKVLLREETLGASHAERLQKIQEDISKIQVQKDLMEQQWDQEKKYVEQICSLEKELEQNPETDSRDKKEVLKRLEKNLEVLRQTFKEKENGLKEGTLVPQRVTADVVAHVISSWTGIPLGKMVKDEIQTVLGLKKELENRIVGQSHALDTIARRLRTYKAGLDEPGKPIGVFLLVGPSGVGKTETAHALADILYGGEKALITINMSEYQEAYTVSTLKGSPPGYVGFGQGGVLTEAVRRNPYSVVLLDEIEKAHADVLELFYQVFDKGVLEDSEGIEVDFKNTVILLTSNVGSEILMSLLDKEDEPVPTAEKLLEALRPDLVKVFKPAFLGRLVVVPYHPLGEGYISQIVKLKLQKIQRRFFETHRATLTFDENVVSAITERCEEVESGARAIDTILTQNLLPGLSSQILERMIEGTEYKSVHISLDTHGDEGFSYTFM